MNLSAFRKKLSSRNLLLLLAFVVLVYLFGLLVILLCFPGDGVGVYVGRQLIVKQTPPGSALQSGDAIMEIAGRELNEELLQPGVWRAALFTGDQTGRHYTIMRGGKTFQIEVPWSRPPLALFLGRAGVLFAVGLSLLLSAIVLLRSNKGQEHSTQLLAFAFTLMALNQINNALPASNANVLLAWSWLFIPLDAFSIVFASGLTLHALLLFPETKSLLRRSPRLPWLIYLTPLVLSILAIFLWGDGTVLGSRDAYFAVANPLMVVELLGGVISLGHTYLTGRQPGVRNQIRWIFWGMIVALLPWMLFYVIPSIIWGSPWLPLSVTNMTVIFVPLTFTIAIFRYGLMEIDWLINRTLVYTLLTGLLAVIYLLTVSVVGKIFEQHTGVSNDFLAGVIATVVLFLLFNPLRIYTQRFVDRTLYREQLDLYQVIREISEDLSDTILLGDVVTLLTRKVPWRLGLSAADLLLLDEPRKLYRSSAEGTWRIPTSSPLVKWLQAHNSPLAVHKSSRFPPEVRSAIQELAEQNVEICLPLHHHGVLTGLYLFGSKLSGNLLNRQEVEALVLFGHQAAAALQNAQQYRELRDYSRQLEARVAARTAELLDERDRLDTILQNIADGLVVTDTGGTILLSNPAFLRIVGRPTENVIGHALWEVFPFAELEALSGQVLEQPNEVVTVEVSETQPAAGRAIPNVYRVMSCALLQRRTPLLGQGLRTRPEISGVVTLLHDVTREAEVDRLKNEFLSTVSHELRTPLTSILGFARVIRRNLKREIIPKISPDDLRGQQTLERILQNLNIINSEGERLTSLINDVLDVAKLEAGKIEWELAPVDIAEVIESSVAIVTSLAETKQLPLRINLPSQLPPVYADRDRLVQVVTNLLSNAIKFTDAGQIEVRATVVELPAGEPASAAFLGERCPPLSPGRWLAVSVADTGIGIAEENLTRIFDRFQQVGDLITGRPRGTGLGLAICQQIIDYHGGRIWAESVPGEGSTFTFVLPLAVDTSEGTTAP